MRYHRSLALILIISCTSPPPGASSNDATSEKRPLPKPVAKSNYLGKAGPVEIDLNEYRRAISETRILRKWRTGQAAPLAALKDRRLRKQILTRALETRLVRREVNRRRLVVPPKDMEGLLVRAALGIQPDSGLSKTHYARAPKDIDRLEAKVVAQFGAPFSHVKRVAQDFIEHRVLAEDLLNSVPESKRKEIWLNEKTCIRLELFRVPRVPTGVEITDAVQKRHAEFDAYYQKNPRLFKTPARSFVRRFLLPNTDRNKDVDVKKKLATYRKRIQAGDDMETLVRQFATPRDRRSGGRVTVSKRKRPDLHELKDGALTQIEQHPEGWVFYKIEGHGEGVHRLLTDNRVQREIAAALLRRDDRLIHAKQTAGLIALRLRQERTGAAFKALLKKERIRVSETKLFCRSKARLIPTIGLAPELTTSVFELRKQQPVGNPVKVRQYYVVARLIERVDPTDAEWKKQAESFTAQWLDRERPLVVKKWIRSQLNLRDSRLDMKRVHDLTLAELKWDGNGIK
jgi:hypothetical protein